MPELSVIILAPEAGWGGGLPGDIDELRRALLVRAGAWAAELAPGRAWLCGEGEAGLPRAPGPLDVAVAHAHETSMGPVLVACAEIPMLAAAHGAGALADLRGGCSISVGPTFDGGAYLFALAAGEELAWPERMDASALGAALGHGHRAGLLRAERALRQAGDATALLADPLCPPAIRAALGASTL